MPDSLCRLLSICQAYAIFRKRPCLMNMQCAFPLSGVLCCYHYSYSSNFFQKIWLNAVLTRYFFVLGIVALSATLLPAIKRYFPKHWNDDVISWHFPYFRCM
ncbi:hypothetical protein Peur_035190 [Populus x canadensis]